MHPGARLRDVVPSAYLRVFQPLDAFDRQEQLRWERYLLTNMWVPGRRQRYLDHAQDGLGVIAPAEGEHAEVRVVDGRTYVSPWRMRMRVLAAALAFREAKPLELSERFLSKKDAKRVARELNRLRRRDPLAVAFCHQSPWHVPIRWFVLFADGERWLGEDEHGRLRLRYRTTARRALRRAGQAIPVLRRSDLGPISDLLMDMHEWIALFDSRSLVELDYGSLCDFLTWDELDDDRSVRDPRPRARGAGAPRVPALGRDLPGRAVPLGRDPGSRTPELEPGQTQPDGEGVGPHARRHPSNTGRPSGVHHRMDEPVRLVVGAAEERSVTQPVTFDVFFDREARTLFRRLCAITGNAAEAEEIMQDAFLALWERWDRIGSLTIRPDTSTGRP